MSPLGTQSRLNPAGGAGNDGSSDQKYGILDTSTQSSTGMIDTSTLGDNSKVSLAHSLEPNNTIESDVSCNNITHSINSISKQSSYQSKRRRKGIKNNKNVTLHSISPNKDRAQMHLLRKTNLSRATALRKQTLHVSKRREFLRPYGDPMHIQQEWPNNNTAGIFRVLGTNINGISAADSLLDWDITLGHMIDLQTDCLCITEANLDLRAYKVRDALKHASKSFDRHMSLTFTSSQQAPLTQQSFYKPGGTITVVNGAWSGRVQMQHIPQPLKGDKFQRWGSTHLIGKSGIVTIITAYRVCDQRNGAGDNTIYLQQQADLETAYKRPIDPRKQFLRDLHSYITLLHEKGHKVILTGDFNKNLKSSQNEVQTFLKDSNLINVYNHLHPSSSLPTTYDKGSSCLDLIAMSKQFPPEVVKRTGFLPFYHPFASDHRSVYCDFDANTLFGKCSPDIIRPFYRQFHTKNVKLSQRYLHSFENKLQKSKIFHLTKQLKEKILQRDKGLPHTGHQSLINACITLEKKVFELMRAATKSVGRTPYTSGFCCTREVQAAGHARYCAKKLVRQVSVGIGSEIGVSEEEAVTMLRAATKKLREAQVSSRDQRDTMLQDLAKKRAKEWRMEAESAIKIIRNAEKAKRQFSKITRTMKGGHHGSLRNILVPSAPSNSNADADSTDPSQWERVYDPHQQHEVLLRRNSHHLTRSHQSMFARGPMLNAIGWDAMGPDLDSILEGRIDAELLGAAYPEFGPEAAAFIRALRYPTKQDGSHLTDKFDWHFGLEEYRQVFSKTSEETACGPSGLHMSYWKVALEREHIAEVHAFFVWAAFELGFSYPRWETSWHCMLQKKRALLQ